ncbi:hypothetical protein ONS95_011472 [Cadophora gregata]|uniref:uncharacterized protein n=1 Tax=Cadophora gregata TaxID=51156 RepID=UPI0026DA7F32|nr:uncharacterized protein ONS95_011472 [Cadophora gregata]KAK0120059.1 hypothetical protein ONS95_011472 [Cadophora gregata]KAK0121091.1 hypothetical protein ONS96_011273 [Cadophora gregata f. sp. sojae]
MALQESKAEEELEKAVAQRCLEVKTTWENHVLQLLDRGMLDQQPDVRAVEAGIVYDLRILGPSNGNLKIVTSCEIEHVPEGTEKGIYRAELVIEVVSGVDLERWNSIPATTIPVKHAKSNCMVCFSHPEWCYSISDEGMNTPSTVSPVYEKGLGDIPVSVSKPRWRDWGLLHGIYDSY